MLFITGCAPSTMDDIEASRIFGPGDYCPVGLDAVDRYRWPVAYVATFHPGDIPGIYRRREAIGGNLDFRLIGHEHREGIHVVISSWWEPSGSSALLAVQAAIEVLDYEKIILLGCPLEGRNENNSSYETFRKGWEARKQDVIGRVKSMSGWTREFLGPPTPEWVNERID